jgi:23S rRNA (adenine1618-N6)-methyltransferase
MKMGEEPRGTYDQVDFEALAVKDEDFKKKWDEAQGHLDFQQPQTCKALAKAILNVDFDLKIELPDDRLCPPIPNRWNYVHWIQTLIDSTGLDYANAPESPRRYDPNRNVVGLDIGTGASAIYALLFLKTRPNWEMCVTDVDKRSFDAAARNLAINNMLTRTKMVHTIESDSLISLRALGVEALDFTICNPPFFVDEKDMQASLKGEGKTSGPNAVCTGAETEMVCPGGDLGFVTRIVNESLELQEKVTWYSSMLGKLSSAKAIIELLKKNGVQNWAVGSLKPGRATKRWVVAWSFGDMRPPNVSLSNTLQHDV